MKYRTLRRTGVKPSPCAPAALTTAPVSSTQRWTRAHLAMSEDPNRQGKSRRWVTRALEDSLRRLDIVCIDLHRMRCPDPETDVEALATLTDLMRAGRIRAIGSSATPAAEIAEAPWVADRRGLRRFRAGQPPYSVLDRIDAIPAPGTGAGALGGAYNPPTLTGPARRRRPTATCDAA
ncbi:aldo/keto reductase [Streptomyces sp. NPDC055089]